MAPEDLIRWTSRFGSLVTTIFGLGAVDGLNERDLGAHLLSLNETDFGPRDPGRPGVHVGLWAQYLLDVAAPVDEALAALEPIQVVMVEARGRKGTLHLALEDASGASAVVEFIAGRPVIHHGRAYTIMTNDPSYDEQLALLAQHDDSHPSRNLPTPGNVSPVDRFQRAAYVHALLPTPRPEREAVAASFGVIRNVSVPFGAPYGECRMYNSEDRTVAVLTNRCSFFELTTNPSLVWAELAALDLDEGAPVVSLDPDDLALCGGVATRFLPTDARF